MPRPLRVAAFVQAILLAALALIVLASAGMVNVALVEDWPWLIWLPVAVSGVAVALNASTRSQGERRIWLPVAIVLLLCSLGVALA
jgi:cytochrome bd-type quinol oxidase subunit 2